MSDPQRSRICREVEQRSLVGDSERQCFSFTVDWGDGPPADAKPLNIPGYPDLYGVTADGSQQFYLRIAPGVDSYHPNGGWVVTTIAADAPTADVVKLIFVPNR